MSDATTKMCRLNVTFLCVHFCSKFAATIPRPFGVRFNAYTDSIELLDSKYQLGLLMQNLSLEFQTLQNAFTKLSI